MPKDEYIGFSITQGNKYRKKSWPIDRFVKLANLISKKNKVPVFFIEKDNIELTKEIKSKVHNALFPEHHSNLNCPALVTALGERLEKAVSIDNGVMHMLGLAKIPMVLLFGPTNSKKFAPDQKNVKILDSNKMYGVKDINKITVDDVLETLNF